MARRKRGRDVDGVLLLDKPAGCSSNAALQRARCLFDARKAGHTGSLDPLATGLLPICFGEATKLSAWLLHADKRYRVTADLRWETDTGDREGQPTRHAATAPPDRAAVMALLQRFTGAQRQIPPMYSALKRNGRPLYELARAGIEVERKARDIIIRSIVLRDLSRDSMTLDVAVSRGTYVRTLVEDIARAWGGSAHVDTLRRTGVGAYTTTAMLDFERLARRAEQGVAVLDDTLVSASQALNDWPTVALTAEQTADVGQGRAVALSTGSAAAGWVRIMDAASGFLGLGEVGGDGVLHPRKMFTRVLR